MKTECRAALSVYGYGVEQQFAWPDRAKLHKSNTGLAPFSHNLEHQVERLLLCFSWTGKP